MFVKGGEGARGGCDEEKRRGELEGREGNQGNFGVVLVGWEEQRRVRKGAEDTRTGHRIAKIPNL